MWIKRQLVGLVLLFLGGLQAMNADQVFERRNWTWSGPGGRYGLTETECLPGLGSEEPRLSLESINSTWETRFSFGPGYVALPVRAPIAIVFICTVAVGSVAFAFVYRGVVTRRGDNIRLDAIERNE